MNFKNLSLFQPARQEEILFSVHVIGYILSPGKQKTCNVLPLGTKLIGNYKIGWFFQIGILRKPDVLSLQTRITNYKTFERNVTKISINETSMYSLPDTMRASFGPTVCMLPISN